MRKKSVPCQAVPNILNFVKLPKLFQDILRLERLLVSRRILSKKVTVMPKGKSLKIEDSICNIPVLEVDGNYKMLPRPANSNGLIIVKLKRKLEYKGHAVFKAVRPDVVVQFLEFLRSHSDLYLDIEINPANITVDTIYSKLLKCLDEPIEKQLESLLGEETLDDPLSEFRTLSMKTAFVSEIPSACEMDEGIVVAPGEGKKPVSILNDKFWEELVHPHLFPTDQYGYKIEREIPLTLSKYFNQRLLHYTQNFTSGNDYIFFEHTVLQRVELSSQINIALKKVLSYDVTSWILSTTFKQRVREFIAKGKSFSFIRSIKGTPEYWKKFLTQVLAMVKQLGTPTFFLTFSCANM